MKLWQGWIVVCLLAAGCAPCRGRSAFVCPTGSFGPTRIVSVTDCDTSSLGSTYTLPPGSMAPSVAGPGAPVEQRVNSLENDLRSLKSDVGDVQRQNNQMDRKLDKLIDNIGPLK